MQNMFQSILANQLLLNQNGPGIRSEIISSYSRVNLNKSEVVVKYWAKVRLEIWFVKRMANLNELLLEESTPLTTVVDLWPAKWHLHCIIRLITANSS